MYVVYMNNLHAEFTAIESMHIEGLLSYFTCSTQDTPTSSRNMPNRFQTRPLNLMMAAYCVCHRVSLFPMKKREKKTLNLEVTKAKWV